MKALVMRATEKAFGGLGFRFTEFNLGLFRVQRGIEVSGINNP